MNTKQTTLALAITAVLPLLAGGHANAATTTIVLRGQSVSGGATLDFLSTPVINAGGQVAFHAFLAGQTANNEGIYWGDGAFLDEIARGGQPGPGGAVFLVLLPPSINDDGQILFRGLQASGSFGFYLGGGGTTTSVASTTSQNAPGGGTFTGFGQGALNAAGQVAFSASRQIDTTVSTGLFLASRGAIGAVALQGQAAPGGGSFTFFGSPVLNEAGQIAFRAVQSDAANPNGIYLAAGGTTTLVARQGQAAPRGGILTGFGDPTLNATGQVAFLASSSDPTAPLAIFRTSGGTLTTVASVGQLAPGGGTFTNLNRPLINDAGEVAFGAAQSDPTSGSGIYRTTGSSLSLIARVGQGAPGGNGTIAGLQALSLLGGGAILFGSNFTGTSGNGSDDFGLFLADGTDSVEVMRKGKLLAGRTVSALEAAASQHAGGDEPANGFGQVAYKASFTDGTSGVFVFTPELRWRSTSSGNWDAAANWTLGIGPDRVHDVRIDPAASVTVTGPGTDRTLRTLQVGGGTGAATLRLASGATITTLDGPVQVMAGGVLTGDGVIGASLHNAGTVIAQNLTILTLGSRWTNAGVVTGNGGNLYRIAGDVANLSAGVIRVGASERLLLQGASHLNAGRIEVLDGRLEIVGTLSNPLSLTSAVQPRIDVIDGQLEVAGRLTNGANLNFREALLRFNGGLTNTTTGLVGVSFGTSDVFGAIVNQGSGPTNRGRIILSGGASVTFYDAITNNGELRVSAGANAVFFGLVNGIGAFTGSGAKFFEGGFSPGLSPALIELDGPVTFGTSSLLTIELAGTRRISEPFTVVDDGYDRVKVNGLLELLGGPLSVVLLGDFHPAAGQSFDVLDWSELSGTFGTVSLPTLAPGLAWDASRLYSDGVLSVAAVPEPHEYLLMLTGLAFVGMAVRRQRARRTNAVARADA